MLVIVNLLFVVSEMLQEGMQKSCADLQIICDDQTDATRQTCAEYGTDIGGCLQLNDDDLSAHMRKTDAVHKKY